MNTIIDCFDYYMDFAKSEYHPIRNKIWLALVALPWVFCIFCGDIQGTTIPVWIRLLGFILIPSALLLHALRQTNETIGLRFQKWTWVCFLVFLACALLLLVIQSEYKTGEGLQIAIHCAAAITILFFILHCILNFFSVGISYGFVLLGLQFLYLVSIPIYLYAAFVYWVLCAYGSSEDGERIAEMRRLKKISQEAETAEERNAAKEELSYNMSLLHAEVKDAEETTAREAKREAEEKQNQHIRSTLAGGRPDDFDNNTLMYDNGTFESGGHTYRSDDYGFTWTDEQGKRFDRDGDLIDN